MPKKEHLLIISDSPMCHDGQGVRIFEATLREVEHLTEIFENITWIGFNRTDMLLGGSRYDSTGKITAIPLKLSGGNGLVNKLKQLFALPSYWLTIWKHLKHAKYVHTRAPSIPSLLVLLYNFIDHKRHYWHKFAGNWASENPPKSYDIQKRFMLRLKHSKVTINGKWPDQRPHVLAFENPCFSEQELVKANKAAESKKFNDKLNILFVGRIEIPKGVGRLIEGLLLLDDKYWEQIGWVKLAGNGLDFEKIKKHISILEKKIELTGSLGREQLNILYSAAHLLLLPTECSEGFPKVVSEAAAHGCIPIVTDVSSLTQYIKHLQNGLVLQNLSPEEIKNNVQLLLDNRTLSESISKEATKQGPLFTYERYNKRIVEEVFGIVDSI
ncbi:MAG: glycosyltransferase [Bacteroidota bacterium]|nr:glycosyltransferase [Bacteroidota bacterium]